jgi:hypothetical protein
VIAPARGAKLDGATSLAEGPDGRMWVSAGNQVFGVNGLTDPYTYSDMTGYARGSLADSCRVAHGARGRRSDSNDDTTTAMTGSAMVHDLYRG